LFGVGELLGRALIVGYVNFKVRLTQIKIKAANQQQNDEDCRQTDSLHTTPFESLILSLIHITSQQCFTNPFRRSLLLLGVGLLAVVTTPSTLLALDTLQKLLGKSAGKSYLG
jgi:hypothetical protein